MQKYIDLTAEGHNSAILNSYPPCLLLEKHMARDVTSCLSQSGASI